MFKNFDSEPKSIAYMANSFVQATMPHSERNTNEFTRKNGKYTLTMIAPSEIGLPYGSIPRLILIWITTEATLTKCRELFLGNSLNAFLKKLDIKSSGGNTGPINNVKDQMRRLFNTSIHCNYLETEHYLKNSRKEENHNFLITEHSELWWDATSTKLSTSFESSILLSESFFEHIIKNPIPIDMRALKNLRKSPLRIDIYTWLTYRYSYLRKPTNVTWKQLSEQIGASYPDTVDGLRDFRKNFIKQSKKVLMIYTDANVIQTSSGILLMPSKPHVPKSK